MRIYALQQADNMNIDKLTVSQISEARLAYLMDVYRAMDTLDADAAGKFLADDCKVRFANAPEVTGAETAKKLFADFWLTIASMEHSLDSVLGQDDLFAFDVSVRYTLKDGRTIDIPASTFIEVNADALISRMKIYIDLAPLSS